MLSVLQISLNKVFCKMYDRETASMMRKEFWTTFGKYMRPVPSSEGLKINWMNYHTGVRDVFFRMDAGVKSAFIAISIEHRDPEIQALYFEQFLELKSLLHSTLGEEWQWQLHLTTNENKIISRIYMELKDVSVFDKAQWPRLISFFKPRIIALDSFWENARYSFEGLL